MKLIFTIGYDKAKALTAKWSTYTGKDYNRVSLMKYDIPFRVRVTKPLEGVLMRVQSGKNDLLSPIAESKAEIVFEFYITVDLSADAPNFLGKFSQGPKSARFVYINSGRYAGQGHTMWNRRAKLSLMSITKEQIEDVVSNGSTRIETIIDGVGRDGGPVCASVKGLTWSVSK